MMRITRETIFGICFFCSMFSRGVSTMAKEIEMRKGARTSEAYFIMTKSMEIEVISIRNWFMGHAFCIV